jgi:type I restriction enzyme M protein
MSQKSFTEEERNYFYKAIEHQDPEKEYVNFDITNDTLSYTGKIKSYENITGTPTDEELTRALIILHLINTYGYDSDLIEIENSYHTGGHNTASTRSVETDICIKNLDGDIEILCEVKRVQDYLGSHDDAIKNQLFTPYENIVKYNKAKYLFHLTVDVPIDKSQFPLNCIGIDTDISKTFKDWSSKGKVPHLIDVVESGVKPKIKEVYLKTDGKEKSLNKKFKDLNDNFDISHIKRCWSKLWDYIWGGSLEDNKKFENFNKVLLAKIYDERKTKVGSPYSFQRKFVGNILQSETELANNVNLLYKKAYKEYLSKDKSIELSNIKGIDFKEFPPYLVARCVELLYTLSFNKNRYKNVDILGEFYEMVIRDAFKQTKGLFLTHPNIVLFILSVLEVDKVVTSRLREPEQDPRYRLPFVIDPSCGTGTFLVHYMNYVQKFIEENYKTIALGDEDTEDFIERHVLDKSSFKWVIDYVYGIDIEPVLATACQINLILHGDGSTNIYNASGLSDFQEYSKKEITGSLNILSSNISNDKNYYDKDTINKFDFIVSNPPFNVNINKNEIKDNFDIKGKSEAYFLERWYQLLKPNGRIGVVLPESFFSVEDDSEGRMFLYKHFNIKTIVALPSHTFLPHTPTNTSLLFASKKTEKEEEAFNKSWIKYESQFDTKLNSILTKFPKFQKDVDFDVNNQDLKNNIKNILQKIEKLAIKEYNANFVTFPFYSNSILFDNENYGKIKKEIKNILLSVKNRWVLHMTSKENQNKFYNFSVEQIGYKAGKKGSKDKPNELVKVLDKSKQQIYDIKYSHLWDKIDSKDKTTVLGQIKGLKIWQ